MHVFDLHTDIFAYAARHRVNGSYDTFVKQHLPPLKSSNVQGLIMVMWISPEFTNAPVKRFKELVPLCLCELEASKPHVRLVRTVAEANQALNDGVIYAFLGVEGASGFADGLSTIQELYDLGVRHIGLSWNEENQFATGAGSYNTSRGLTALGKDAIALMDELGIAADLSHLNEKSTWEVLEITKGPVLATHSNARSLCPAARNLTDQQIRAIAQKGGVIGMNAWGAFVKSNNPTLYDFIDHMDHIINIAGEDALAFGFDFCNFFKHDPLTPKADQFVAEAEGITTWRDIPSLLHALKNRGYTENRLEKIAYKNAHRVLKAIIKS